MKTLFEKIRNSRGASMLIALLVFFLAIFSGTVALTMASSNAGRYTHEREDQQAYLSVASAAKLILGKLENPVHFKSTERGYAPKNADEVEFVNLADIQKLGLFFSDANFQKMLRTFAYQPGDTVDAVAFTLSVENAPEMGSVHVNIHLQGGEFYFRMYSQRGSSLDYQMTMKVATNFDGKGTGNFTQGPEENDFFYRDLNFDTDGAIFTAEKLQKETGGEGA